MLVYKGMNRGQVCRGTQLHPGLNIEKEANCVANGWHAAEDPLDCLTYYPCEKDSEYWLCEAAGDIDEDGTDSKISCTHLTLVKRLTMEEFVLHAIAYMLRYPERRRKKAYHHNSIHIVCGGNPKASGNNGDTIGLLRERAGKRSVAVFTVDGEEYLPHVAYTIGKDVVVRA